jgi:hypothetical protein
MSAVAKKFLPLLVFVLATGLVLFTSARPLFAQTTVGTGGIVGTVSDPSGAMI